MLTFLRTLPQRLWWVTLSLAGFAVLAQIAVALARSGSVSAQTLLTEFILSLALLAVPVGIAWRGRQEGSLWYATGALVLLVVLGKIFFM